MRVTLNSRTRNFQKRIYRKIYFVINGESSCVYRPGRKICGASIQQEDGGVDITALLGGVLKEEKSREFFMSGNKSSPNTLSLSYPLVLSDHRHKTKRSPRVLCVAA